MADHDHLTLTRVQRPPKARRKVRSGYRPSRRYEDFEAHASQLETSAESSIAEFRRRRETISDFDPKFILRFDLHRRVLDEEWARSGLTILDSSDQHAVIVFASDEELDIFRSRLGEYAEGPGEPRPREDGEGETEPTARYEGFFDAIQEFRAPGPADRLTPRLTAALSAEGEVTRPFDVEFWFSSNEELRNSWMNEATQRAEALEGELLDAYVNRTAGIALARFRGNASVIAGLADLDQIASIDLVPDPVLEQGELAQLQEIDHIETANSPPEDAPIVGIVDSGVLSGHPFLEAAIAEATALHPEFGGQGEDSNGHGTLVAGIVLYGNVLAAARTAEFDPDFWLASVRVLDDDAAVPETVNWVKAISEGIRYLAESWQVRVINLSIGDSENPFGGGKSTPLAAELDSLARRFGLVLIVSAGNLDETAMDHDGWPDYLYGDSPTILDPAQASASITVGAVSAADGLTERTAGSTLDAVAIAERDGPAPFTTRGPGVRGAIKPELVADGGNRRYDRGTTSLHRDPGIEVISTSSRYPERLLEAGYGTSFAAPAVANIAGRLVARYPGFSANAIRALMLQGAANSAAAEQMMAERYEDAEQRLYALCGYGGISWERCGFSDDGRVVMIAEDALRPEDFHIYRIPMTDGFKAVSGAHQISVGLAFSPPVRHRRFDYLAYQMDFQLTRAIELDALFELASAEFDAPDGEKLTDYELSMRPARTVRNRGANQMARYTTTQRPQEKFHDDWYLVVKSLNKWMPRDSEPQPYAVAVSLEAERSNQLFVELEAELRAEIELRV